jgi:RNA polymerase sigma-70 factor (ECF subfamily)
MNNLALPHGSFQDLQIGEVKMQDVTAERSRQSSGNNCEQVPLGTAEGVRRPRLEDFEGIYRQYGKRVYSLRLRLTGNKAEAEDLTQEAFLQLFRKLDTFRGDSSFYTWLYRLAVNVVLMQFRKRAGLMETSLEGAGGPPSHDPVRLPDIPVSDTRLLGTIDRVSLEEALKKLAPGFRIVFVLHDIEGFEHPEIAEMLGCSVGTSKSQLHRARLKLRSLLVEGSKGLGPGETATDSRPCGAARCSMPTEAQIAV